MLAELDLTIDAGERVAIVGESGSGKSSFLGALSGWHTISDGRFLIDGDEADAAQIQALRQHSALVDPETYLWNRELYANVLYGVGADATPAIDSVLDASELVFDLEKMADGLATRIGENGSRLSGGESQRLRIARALVRGNARLVLLDEPFSGMDADQRERMRRHVDRALARSDVVVGEPPRSRNRDVSARAGIRARAHRRRRSATVVAAPTVALCRNDRGRRCAATRVCTERRGAWSSSTTRGTGNTMTHDCRLRLVQRRDRLSAAVARRSRQQHRTERHRGLPDNALRWKRP